MAYTRVWTKTDPPGATLAKDIDTKIQNLREDIEERFETFVVDMVDDPIVIKDEIKGKVTARTKIIPFTAFANWPNEQTTLNAGYLDYRADYPSLQIPIPVPVGCTLTLIELLADKNAASQITWTFFKRTFVAGGLFNDKTAIGADVIHNAIGVAISATAALTEVVDGNTMYWIQADVQGSGGVKAYLIAARITYNVPDSRSAS